MPSVATTIAWVSPRVNSAEPWVRGRKPTSATIGRTVDEIAAVDALAGVEDVPAHDLGFEILEHAGDLLHRTLGIVRAVREEMRHRLLLDGGDRILPLGLARDRVGLAQILLDDAEHFLFDRGGVGHREFARLLRGLFRQLDDGVDHRLEVPVAEHHRAEHDFLGQLLGFRFHHQHGVLACRRRPGRAGSPASRRAVGLSTYSLLTKPTRAAPIGPMKGTPDSVSAAEAATMATISGSFS